MEVTEDIQPKKKKKNYNSLLLLSLSQPFSITFLGGDKSFRKYHHLSSKSNGATLTHEVHDQLAHPGTEDEVPHEVGDEREGDADHRHHQVAGGQRQQEEVGDGPHALVPHQHGDDEAVAQDAEQEDQAVEDDPHRLVDVCGGDEDTRARQRLRHS